MNDFQFESDLTPLAVSHQTVSEAGKFDIEAHRSPDGRVTHGIHVTNYERLHHFRADDFAGVVCDESKAQETLQFDESEDIEQ